MPFTACKISTALEFAVLARQIETKVDSELLSEIQYLECLNAFSDFLSSKGDELIPVGSCVDGSKLTIPGDSGDLDVLVVSNQIILEESLFDYNLNYPAFLHIRLDREHKTFFHDITDSEHGDYLPAYFLKQFHKKLFCFGRLIVLKKTSAGISEDGDFFNLTRNSSVGFERNQLDLDKFLSLGYRCHQETRNSGITRVAKSGLGMFTNFFQGIYNQHGSKSFQIVLNEKYIHKLYQTVEKLAEEDKNCKNDEIDRELKQKFYFNSKLRNDFQNDNNVEKQYETVNRLDQKKVVSTQIDKVKVARVKTDADSTHIEYNKLSVEQQNREREGRRKTQDGSDVSDQTNCKGKQLSFRKFKSADFVPAFKFKGWPRPAEEWMYRKRKWPHKRIMKEVLDVGCQIVAKCPRIFLAEDHSCGNVVKEDNDLSFRLSFALCEVALAKDMSEQQLLCWRVLKAYQKCFLITTPQSITSYHWKNIIFWVFEEFDQSFWNDSHVLDGVEMSLNFMISCLEQRFLPFYFVRKMNLLHGYNETIITDVLKRVKMIRSSPILYLKRYLKFQGMSNVESISIDQEIIEDVITEKHKLKEINEEDECFSDWSAAFYKCCLESNESQQFRNGLSKFNTILQAVRRYINTSDNNDDELTYHYLAFIDALEQHSEDKKDITEAYTAIIIAFEKILQYILQNEEIRKEIDDNNFTMAFESIIPLLSTFPQFLTGKRTHVQTFIEKFCDSSETLRKMITGVWTKGAESEDEKTKEKVNAAMSLMKTFSTLIPNIKNVVTTDKKRQMDIDLD